MDISSIFSLFNEITPILNTGNFIIIFYLLFLTKEVKYKFTNIENEQKDLLAREFTNEQEIKKLREAVFKHYMLTKEEALKYLHTHKD